MLAADDGGLLARAGDGVVERAAQRARNMVHVAQRRDRRHWAVEHRRAGIGGVGGTDGPEPGEDGEGAEQATE